MSSLCAEKDTRSRNFFLVHYRRMWYTGIAVCGYDEIGRHARFRFSCSDALGFESPCPHQIAMKSKKPGVEDECPQRPYSISVLAAAPHFREKAQCFLYPHFGQTPSPFRATPHSGQRSIWFLVSNSAEAALTPLVKVSLAMFSLSFSRS